MLYLIVFSFLVIFGFVLLAVSFGLKFVENQRKSQVSGMLRTVEDNLDYGRTDSLLRDNQSTSLDVFKDIFGTLNFYRRLEDYSQQSGGEWHPAAVLVAMFVLAIAGAFIGLKVPVLVFWQLSTIACSLALGSLPYFLLRHKRNKRLGEFEAQFPEGLDFLARSMRAGHAFSVSLEMLSSEFPAPLGLEFRKAFNEQNLGAPIDVALNNLSVRIPLVDVRFFVSAVMLQRETGGNLGEILQNLARVIRERFRLRGQVKAASAHGRLTATILVLLPIVLMVALTFVAPGYLQSMADDPDGKWMIVGAILGQLVGYYFIRRIIDIKV